jgi:hypothetical protein
MSLPVKPEKPTSSKRTSRMFGAPFGGGLTPGQKGPRLGDRAADRAGKIRRGVFAHLISSQTSQRFSSVLRFRRAPCSVQ